MPGDRVAGGERGRVAVRVRAGTYQTQVSGATWLSLTVGTVLPGGVKPQSVTLNGQKVHYGLVTTTRGTAVEVAVKAPAAQETLAVQASG